MMMMSIVCSMKKLLEESEDFLGEVLKLVEKISNVKDLNDHHLQMEMDFPMDRYNLHLHAHLNMYLIEGDYLLELNFDYEDNMVLNMRDKIKYLIDRMRFLVM
jgi:hypothetical protein